MIRSSRYTLCSFTFLCVVLLLQGCVNNNPPDTDGLYDIFTADGVNIKMRRYRPTPEAEFRQNGTPIVLFPGFLFNNNLFNARTPPERQRAYSTLKLPQTLAPWAVGDPYIENDHMRYYSFAHYLWTQGYDVWLSQYRGHGRGAFKSQRGSPISNMDVLAALDVPPAIDKVIEVTGKSPFIGGHSTGGMVCYMYLQGITIDTSIFPSQGYVPHVQSDPRLVAERNAKIRGFVGFDPAGELQLITRNLLNNPITWAALSTELFIDLDGILGDRIEPLLPPAINVTVIEVVFGIISILDELLSPILPETVNIFGALNMWEVNKTNRFVEDYLARKVLASFDLASVAQYADWGINVTQREYWNNGQLEKIDNPGPKVEGDGYYYYNENMHKMSVPAISVFSESSSLVDTNFLVRNLFESKTPHPMDVWHEIPDSAHVDIVFSEDAPTIVFPLLGNWLDELTSP